jgi:hypothetical protein
MEGKLSTLAFVFAIFIASQSCEYHDLDPPKGVLNSNETDTTLFIEMNEAGYKYYRSGAILNAASESPHGSFKLRFNNIAWSALDNSGKLPVGQTFPEGSIIVKEVYTNNKLFIYAVMKKEPSDPNAVLGWIWAEYRPDGSPAFSLSGKGVPCTGCHSESLNRDYVRVFDLH